MSLNGHYDSEEEEQSRSLFSLKNLFFLFIITHSSKFNVNIFKVQTGPLIHLYFPPVHVLANLAAHCTHPLIVQVLVPR